MLAVAKEIGKGSLRVYYLSVKNEVIFDTKCFPTGKRKRAETRIYPYYFAFRIFGTKYCPYNGLSRYIVFEFDY